MWHSGAWSMGQGHGAVERDWTGQPVFHAGPAPSPDRPPQRAECVVSRPRQGPAGRRPGQTRGGCGQPQGKTLHSGRRISESPQRSSIPAWRYLGTGSEAAFINPNPSLPCSWTGAIYLGRGPNTAKRGRVMSPPQMATP